jgi:phosphoribosylanthranilate isomerase
MHVKICGITSREDALAAAESGADFVGLILAPSPRQVTLATAQAVAKSLPAKARPVLVFRDATVGEILAAMEATGCRWVQLHGHEPFTLLSELQARRADIRLIKAWEVSAAAAGSGLTLYLQDARRGRVHIHAVILDAPKGEPHPGFECMKAICQRCAVRPPQIWLAGGLTPGNLATAVKGACYDGVDVAGGVEREPGVKDHAAVRQFIDLARRL